MTILHEYQKGPDYSTLNDEGLIHMVRDGDNSALDFILHKYKDMVKFKAREYFIMGADNDDIMQEGMIGLYKAIRDYKPDKSVPFHCFARICVTRQIITAIKAATRQKHLPLNAYVSLNKPVDGADSENALINMFAENHNSDPEALFIGKEGKNNIENYIGEILSDLECRVLSLHLKGKRYDEIARLVSKNEKAIDNALQRVKHKIELYLSGNINTKPQGSKRKKSL